jgi:hypothetical protein
VITIDSHQARAGAAVAGADVLGRHAYAASATWLLRGPADAAPSRSAMPDWQVSYAYTRWRPVVFANASAETSFFAGPPGPNGAALATTVRETQVEAGVLVPFTHVRTAQTAIASFVRAADDYSPALAAGAIDRAAVRAGYSASTAHRFGYSISAERGAAIGVTAEAVRPSFGSSGRADAVTADARAYLPGLRRHDVLAVRAAAGASTGDRLVRRTFNLGGVFAQATPLDFGREAISLLRGFGADTFAGSHVALANADYRFPIAWPQRGAGTWPVFVRAIHGAVFADAGHAWTRRFDVRDGKFDAGAELALDVVAGYSLPLTVAAGAARAHDGSGLVRDGMSFYIRLGHAF